MHILPKRYALEQVVRMACKVKNQKQKQNQNHKRDRDVSDIIYCEAHLLLVAAGDRPGWLYLPAAEDDAGVEEDLVPRAAELGLEHHYFEGNGEWLERNKSVQFSGHLFYNPEIADSADIELIKRDGWGVESSCAAVGRVLGYDCPGQDGCRRAQICFTITPSRRVKKKDGRHYHQPTKPAQMTLFWYGVYDLNAETCLRAANLAVRMTATLKAGLPRECRVPVGVEFRAKGSSRSKAAFFENIRKIDLPPVPPDDKR